MTEKVNHPGYIMRQSLVLVCEERIKTTEEEADSVLDDVESFLKSKPVEEITEDEGREIEEQTRQHAFLTGYHKALKDIHKWAVSHDAPPKGSIKQC